MFYIHYEDPGFPESPWPNQRRLGPYITVEEAEAQAVENASNGFGVCIGIYSQEVSDSEESQESEKPKGVAEKTRSTIVKKAEALTRKRVREEAKRKQEDIDALSSLLPEGITLEQVLAMKEDLENVSS